MAQPSRASSARDARQIQAIADRLSPRLRRQFLAAVATLKNRISVAAILRAIARGGISIELHEALRRWPTDLQPAARTLNTVFAEAAAASATKLKAPLRIQTSFTLTNPLAVSAADTGTAHLIREITDETRRAVQLTIQRAIVQGIPPREAAKLIQPLVGLTRAQAQAVLNHRARLMAKGLTGDRLIAQTTRYANRLLKLRAENIARTETMRASNDGQLALWKAARRDGLIDLAARKRWIVTHDDRLCPRCAPLHGVEVPLDWSFPGGVFAPPLHPRCRCAMSMVAGVRERRRAA